MEVNKLIVLKKKWGKFFQRKGRKPLLRQSYVLTKNLDYKNSKGCLINVSIKSRRETHRRQQTWELAFQLI